MQQHQHHQEIEVVPTQVPTRVAWGELSPTDAFDEEDGVVGIVIDGCPSNTSWERVCWLLAAMTGNCPIIEVEVERTEHTSKFRACCRATDADALLGADGLALCFPDHVLGFWGGSASYLVGSGARNLLQLAAGIQAALQGNAAAGSILSVTLDFDVDHADPFLDDNDGDVPQRAANARRS